MPQLDSPSHMPQYLGFLCLFWPFHMLLAWRVLPLASQLFEFRAKMGMEKEKTQLWPFLEYSLFLAETKNGLRQLESMQVSQKSFQTLFQESASWSQTALSEIHKKSLGGIQQTYIQSLGEQTFHQGKSLQQLETVVGPLLGQTSSPKNLMISRQEAFDLSYLLLLEDLCLQQEHS
jgi:hypothetical protein